MRVFWMIAGLVILTAGVVWLVVANLDEDPVEPEQTSQEPPDHPQPFDPNAPSAATTNFVSKHNSSFSFDYPEEWNLTEGADNSAESELLTLESPYDDHEFYFCLDLYDVGPSNEADFDITATEILSADPLENQNIASNITSVVYTAQTPSTLQWGITDKAIETGDKQFVSSISNSAGRQLQVLGRFNCREQTKPSLTLDQFTSSLLFNQAELIVLSMNY